MASSVEVAGYDPELVEFYKLSNPRKKPCPVRPALDSISGPQRKLFDRACAVDPGLVSNQALHLWLERHCKEAWMGNWQNAHAHRAKRCSCND